MTYRFAVRSICLSSMSNRVQHYKNRLLAEAVVAPEEIGSFYSYDINYFVISRINFGLIWERFLLCLVPLHVLRYSSITIGDGIRLVTCIHEGVTPPKYSSLWPK